MKVTLIRGRAIDPAVNKLAESLADNGHIVNLLVWDRKNNLINKKNTNYEISTFSLNAPYDKYQALFFIPFWMIYQFIFLIRDHSDVIHPCDLDTLLPAVLVKTIGGKKLCYTIYDFYANNLPDGSLAQFRMYLRACVAFLEKFLIRFTDALFLVDESRYEEISGAKVKDLYYIYNSPPDITTPFSDQMINITKNELVIFYAGIISRSRGIHDMINAVDGLEGVKLILAGNVRDIDILSELDKKYNISYLGWLPSYENVISYTIKSDILFRFSDPIIPKTKYESPNKLFESMMCQKPIIVSDNSSMADIVRKENCGLVVPYGDVEGIRSAIISLRDDKQLYDKLSRNGRKAYDDKYSWSIMEQRLVKAYRNLVEKN